jgi:hypothetical protein
MPESLLFNFCRQYGINPLVVQVGSLGGVRAEIGDVALSSSWQAYHQQHARLRLVEKVANLKIPKRVSLGIRWHSELRQLWRQPPRPAMLDARLGI